MASISLGARDPNSPPHFVVRVQELRKHQDQLKRREEQLRKLNRTPEDIAAERESRLQERRVEREKKEKDARAMRDHRKRQARTDPKAVFWGDAKFGGRLGMGRPAPKPKPGAGFGDYGAWLREVPRAARACILTMHPCTHMNR